MKNQLFTRALSLVLLLLATACGPNEQQEQESVMEDNENPTAAFVANPQAVPEQAVPTLAIGASAPDFNLPGVDGKYHSLSDFAAAKALLIIFTCNHCPTAQAYEDRMIAVAGDYKAKGVATVAISPNSPLGLLYEELGYTDLNDDYEDMIIRSDYKGYNFPYLYDGDDEAVSMQYGPAVTPHAFLFDEDRKLQYVGRLDGSEKPGTANAEDLRAAIDAVLAGETPAEQVTKTFGCSTKWGWKTAYKKKVEEEWAQKEVDLKAIDVDGIKTLLKNEDSEKLRLINVWATWCGPCVIEYPDFIVLQRMYGARDFEFISLSADKIAQKDKALKFLKSKDSAVPNYIFEGADIYEMVEAVDKEWSAALPYTILIEPGGKIIYQKQGEADFLELKRLIVEHPMMGRYF